MFDTTYIRVYNYLMNKSDVKFNSAYLSRLMRSKGLSPSGLSKKMVLSGSDCTPSTVRLWQSGKFPRVETLYALSVIFGVAIENFLIKNTTKIKEVF